MPRIKTDRMILDDAFAAYNKIGRYYEGNLENPSRWRYTIMAGFVEGMKQSIRWNDEGTERRKEVRFLNTWEMGTWGDVLEYLMFHAPYALSTELWEEELDAVTHEDVHTYINSAEFKEACYDIFGRPKVLRYQHDCPDCIPVMMYREYDIYMCKKHRLPGLQFRPCNGTTMMNSRAFNSAELRNMLSGIKREVPASVHKIRAERIALMYVYKNIEKYPGFLKDDRITSLKIAEENFKSGKKVMRRARVVPPPAMTTPDVGFFEDPAEPDNGEA